MVMDVFTARTSSEGWMQIGHCRLVIEGSEAGKALKPYSWELGMSSLALPLEPPQAFRVFERCADWRPPEEGVPQGGLGGPLGYRADGVGRQHGDNGSFVALGASGSVALPSQRQDLSQAVGRLPEEIGILDATRDRERLAKIGLREGPIAARQRDPAP